MVNQVNPTVALVPGTPLTFMAAIKRRLVPEKSPPVDKSESRPEGSAVRDDVDEKDIQDLNDLLKQKSADLLQTKKAPALSYSDLVFMVDKETGSSVFKIVDAKTREVIRQVPSEEVLAMARKLLELSGASDAAGILMDKEG